MENVGQQRDLTQAAEAYAHVVKTLALGLLRFRSAEAAHARLILALLEYRRASAQELDESEAYREVLKNLEKIPETSYDALRYVTDLSLLVYATTLLDTFLLETATFLLLLFPRALGKTQQVSVESLVSALSPNQLLEDAAKQKAREVSYQPFQGRIEYLQKAFGLSFTIDDADMASLEHFPSIRNAAVHDQGVFSFALEADGAIRCRPKACPSNPTPVSEQEIEAAVTSYSRIAGAIASAVMGQCLKAPDHPALQMFKRSPLPPIESNSRGRDDA